MSVVTFDGKRQLGNFLFVAAAAVGYAKLHNIAIYWPVSDFTRYFKQDPTLFNKVAPLRTKIINEESLDYHPLPAPTESEPTTYVLAGYFVHPYYFRNALAEVRELFIVPVPTQVIAMHIRRGDALSHPSYHDLDPSYYIQAWRQLYPSCPGISTIISTDDRTWSESHIIPYIPNAKITPDDSVFSDFNALAAAKYKVLSGSTFSWWAAFLGPLDSVVIHPSPWHKESRQPEIGLEEWHKLDAKTFPNDPLMYLEYVVRQTEHTIIEFGVGERSTPFLRSISDKTGRKLISVESDRYWLDKIQKMHPESTLHQYIFTQPTEWESCIHKLANLLQSEKISVVFADQSPWMARVWTVIHFKPLCDYIIVPDIDYYARHGIFGSPDMDYSAHFKSHQVFPGLNASGPVLVGSSKKNFL